MVTSRGHHPKETRHAPPPRRLFASPPAAVSPSSRTAPPGDKLVLHAGSHRIDELVHRAARFLGRNYILRPGEAVDCGITLQTRMVLDAAGCEDVVSQIMFAHDMVMTPLDPQRGLYEWIHRFGPRRFEITERAYGIPPEMVRRRPAWKVFVATVVPLRHVTAAEAEQNLRVFFPFPPDPLQGVGISAAGGALRLSGFADSVAAALAVLEALDRQKPESLEGGSRGRRDPDKTERLERQLEELLRRVEILEKR